MTQALPPEFEAMLFRVQGPAQYVGGEVNAVVKPADAVRLRVALAFPDLYEVGMSHYGARVLYALINDQAGYAAERVFAPAPDMEAELRAAGRALCTLETLTPLHACDVVGLTLAYELNATSVLTILDLGGVPKTRFERAAGDPFVIAGGHATFNPEPMSDFVDAFVIGEAEEALPELLARIDAAGGRACDDRDGVLRQIATEVAGVYVPSLYDVAAGPGGFVTVRAARDGAPLPVKRRLVMDFEHAPLPTKPVVPLYQTVHERVTLEILRGCPNGCRFCQAGMVCRPVRERSVETLAAAARACVRHTGYDEIGLLSLSTSDYARFDTLLSTLDGEFAPQGVGLSLPSLRVDEALSGIPARYKSVRKAGFTIAPEAATDRLRAAINKHVTNENLLAAADEAFRQGWQGIKLYFMAGLPTETEEDVAAVGALASQVARLKRGKSKKRAAVTLSLSNFVPKSHTPFQWDGMETPDALARKHEIVRAHVDRRRVDFKPHDVETSWLEGILARGDRRLGKVILGAWARGARLDAWSDHFRPDLWRAALSEAGLDGAALACTPRDPAAVLPWSHIDTGVSADFLRRERAKCDAGETTAPCSAGHCAGCGLERCPQRDEV